MAQSRGTLSIRVKGVPFAIEFADWTHDRLYHTVQYAGGQGQEVMTFVGAIGAPIPGGGRVLTEVDTNLPRSGDNGLPEGWEMLVYSIQVGIVREIAAIAAAGVAGIQLQDTIAVQLSRPAHAGGFDPAIAATGGVLFDVLRKTFHRFTVNQKVQSEGPLEKYPQGSGINVFATNAAIEVANNGTPSPRDQVAFVLPIWLKSNISFVGRFRPQAAFGLAAAPAPFYADWSGLPAGVLAFDIRETLEGLLKRPVT